MTHGMGVLWADNYEKTYRNYLFWVVPEECMIMGFGVPRWDAWMPEE